MFYLIVMLNAATTSNDTMLSPRRLRKHSYKDAINTGDSVSSTQKVKMSGVIPEADENGDVFDGSMLIQKDDFAKKTTNQKLDVVAEAMNKLYEKMNDVTKSL